MTYYTSGRVQAEFDRLTKDKKIAVLYNALDYMQQYNGRSRFKCIAMAMGFDNYEGNDRRYFRISENKEE